jgi:hypothetical protein
VERTPDDALRFQSVLFGLSTVLDKVPDLARLGTT